MAHLVQCFPHPYDTLNLTYQYPCKMPGGRHWPVISMSGKGKHVRKKQTCQEEADMSGRGRHVNKRYTRGITYSANTTETVSSRLGLPQKTIGRETKKILVYRTYIGI